MNLKQDEDVRLDMIMKLKKRNTIESLKNAAFALKSLFFLRYQKVNVLGF